MAERPVGKVDLIEDLHLCVDHLTLVVAAILMFCNDSVPVLDWWKSPVLWLKDVSNFP